MSGPLISLGVSTPQLKLMIQTRRLLVELTMMDGGSEAADEMLARFISTSLPAPPVIWPVATS
jgi:hypothetical protein